MSTTLAQLANFVGGKVGLTDTASLTKIKGFATQRYAALFAAALWKDALVVCSKAISAEQRTVVLPHHVAHFVAAKYDQQSLVPVDTAYLFGSDPELWENAGTPTHVSELPPIATSLELLAAGNTLQVRSDQNDTGKVRLHGENEVGEPVEEEITLPGVAEQNVAAANAYTVVYGFSKGTTTGTVTLRKTGSSTVQRLLPGETQRLHRRLVLHRTPPEALTLLVLGKRHPAAFTGDNEATTLPALCDQALQALVHGDALEWMRQYGKAQSKFAEGLALQAQAVKAESYQAAQSRRLVPADSMAEGCNGDSFL